MSREPTLDEWNSLKHQFDVLVRGEAVDPDIEKTFDDQVRRRFAEFINRAMERNDGSVRRRNRTSVQKNHPSKI